MPNIPGRERQRYLHSHLAQRGFSMVELMVVVLIILILVAVALVTMVPTVQNSRANAGMELVLGEMRHAHERAIDERRIYRVTFVPPNQIQVDVGQVANVAATITECSSRASPGYRRAGEAFPMDWGRAPQRSISIWGMAAAERRFIFSRMAARWMERTG